MSQHTASVQWKLRDGEDFSKGRFSREHTWRFDGGLTVVASASPAVVRPPLSNPAGIDPEEAFVASLSSCHMLTFLWLAYREGFQVSEYADDAAGVLTKNAAGVPWVSEVTLQPRITWTGEKRPSDEDIARLHHAAHDQCFISQSVKTDVKVK